MRRYSKQDSPEVLRKWIGSNHPWGNFVADPAAYTQVKQTLLEEQNHLCCYCESAAKDAESHIEHYEPRSRAKNRIYDYTNLACSCNGGRDRDRHCGHRKGRAYDHRLFINPSVDDPGELISYDTEGGIGAQSVVSAEEKDRVQYMIRTLNLDCARLTGMRRAHARGVVQIIQGFLDSGASDQLEKMAGYYLLPDQDGLLEQFFSLSTQLFENCGIHRPEEN